MKKTATIIMSAFLASPLLGVDISDNTTLDISSSGISSLDDISFSGTLPPPGEDSSAVLNVDSDYTINGGTLYMGENTAGKILADSGHKLTITGDALIKFSDNSGTADFALEGDILFTNLSGRVIVDNRHESSIKITGATFEGNNTSGSYCMVYIPGIGSVIQNTVFRNNVAMHGNLATAKTFVDCTFVGNTIGNGDSYGNKTLINGTSNWLAETAIEIRATAGNKTVFDLTNGGADYVTGSAGGYFNIIAESGASVEMIGGGLINSSSGDLVVTKQGNGVWTLGGKSDMTGNGNRIFIEEGMLKFLAGADVNMANGSRGSLLSVSGGATLEVNVAGKISIGNEFNPSNAFILEGGAIWAIAGDYNAYTGGLMDVATFDLSAVDSSGKVDVDVSNLTNLKIGDQISLLEFDTIVGASLSDDISDYFLLVGEDKYTFELVWGENGIIAVCTGVVPEPAACAAIAGGLALALAAYRRRS